MGTRIGFPGWYRPGIRHPLFSYTATSSATLRDRDRRASTAATGRRIVPSIPESLWGKARGVYWRAGRPPEWNAPTRRSAVISRNSRNRNRSTGDQQVADFGRGFWQVEKG